VKFLQEIKDAQIEGEEGENCPVNYCGLEYQCRS
jgi:hypothetical protein